MVLPTHTDEPAETVGKALTVTEEVAPLAVHP